MEKPNFYDFFFLCEHMYDTRHYIYDTPTLTHIFWFFSESTFCCWCFLRVCYLMFINKMKQFKGTDYSLLTDYFYFLSVCVRRWRYNTYGCCTRTFETKTRTHICIRCALLKIVWDLQLYGMDTHMFELDSCYTRLGWPKTHDAISLFSFFGSDVKDVDF